MKIDVSKLSYTKPTSFKEEVVFDAEKFKCVFPLKEVLSTFVDVKVTRYDDFINIHLKVNSRVILISSYSLKEFETNLIDEDELNFTSYSNEYDDEDMMTYQGNQIDLDEYIFSLLSSAVPLKPIKDGEAAPSGGKNFVVTTDLDEEKNKLETGNNKFSKLDELEFD